MILITDNDWCCPTDYSDTLSKGGYPGDGRVQAKTFRYLFNKGNEFCICNCYIILLLALFF